MKTAQIAAVVAWLMVAPAAGAADVPQSLVDSYLRIQAALAADTLEGLAGHAASVAAAAAALGPDGQKLTAAATKLQGATDIAAARTAFGEVSEALLAYAEKSKSDLGPDVRVAFCPMNNKSWLQKEKEIKNPYYGKSMISCGAFKTKN